MTFDSTDRRFMRRALELAARGLGHVSPNPMVGAVVVDPSGRIIGEGWHRRFGGPHAEVNALASVAEADRPLLGASTMYVTLEPCSHYGKTPPCAKLLVETGIGQVVTGAGDPNPKVSGRGIAMLRDAGIEVRTGLLADESRELNKTFITAQTLWRPFVTLKWARSADGFMDRRRAPSEPAAHFSTALSGMLVQLRRSWHDAIAVGARTVLADRPRLDVRSVAGRQPRPVIFDRRGLLAGCREGVLGPERDAIYFNGDEPLAQRLDTLFERYGISSLLVEGGASLLSEFLTTGLWDEAYEEVSGQRLDSCGAVIAPVPPSSPERQFVIDRNLVNFYSHKSDPGVKNI